MAIKWSSYEFTTPELLNSWTPSSGGGIYAITFRPDYKNNPNTYRCVYFGRTNDFEDRGIGDSHHAFECWVKNAGENRLYISIHKESDDDERIRKEGKLIDDNPTACNK